MGTQSGLRRFVVSIGLITAISSGVALAGPEPHLNVTIGSTTGDTTRISTGPGGINGNQASQRPSISADGRFVAFDSLASNLVTADTNGQRDIFMRDRVTNTTSRVSLTTGGAQATGESRFPSISSDGRFVAFESLASNLVTADTNATWDVFVRDRLNGTTIRANVSSAGVQANAISSGDNAGPQITADGRYVVFLSDATNLVAGDTNVAKDVFVSDTFTNTTTLVSLTGGGIQGNSSSSTPWISSGGRYVGFRTLSTNFGVADTNGNWDVYLRDTVSGTTLLLSPNVAGTATGNGESTSAIPSADGRYVLYSSKASDLVSGDTNDHFDTFVRDTQLGTTTRISVGPGGQEASGCPVEVVGGACNYGWALTPNGRYATIGTNDTNVVPGDTNGTYDVLIYDLVTGAMYRASIDSAGRQGTGYSLLPVTSADGAFVAFSSAATKLESWLIDGPPDTNNRDDVFVHEVCLEKGAVSSQVHGQVEPVLGPTFGPLVHFVNCHYVVPASQ